MLLSVCPSFCQSFCNIFVSTLEATSFIPFWHKLVPHFVHTSGSLLISKFKCQRSRSHLNFNHLLVFILVKMAYIFQLILTKLSRHLFHTKPWSLFWRSQLDISFSHLTVRGHVMLCVAFVIVLSIKCLLSNVHCLTSDSTYMRQQSLFIRDTYNIY